MTLLRRRIRDHASHGGICGIEGESRKNETEDCDDSAGVGEEEDGARGASMINAQSEIEAENRGRLGHILASQRF